MMERLYEVTMTIMVDDDETKPGQTVDELVLEVLVKAPFHVDSIAISMLEEDV